MATQVQFRRGTKVQHNSFTGATAEVTVNTTNNSLHVHDGSTVGGFEVAKADLSNHANVGVLTATTFSGNLTGNVTGDLTGTASDATALETARNFSISGDAEAAAIAFDGTSNVGLALTLATVNSNVGSFGSQTEIPVVTVNGKGLITAVTTASVGTALTVAGDSGSEVVNLLTDSLTIAGGTNLTSSAASDTVTINLDQNINLTSVNASGVVTATTFSGALTGNATGLSGTPNITVGNIIASNATISGNVSVAGTLTYEDVTSVDAIGIITARSGINVGTSVAVASTLGTDGGAVFSGIVTATSFYGDGANLTNTGATLSSGSGSQRLVLTSLTSGVMTTTSTDSDLEYNSDTNTLSVGNINASGIVTATDFNSASDQRLKTNIKPIENALDKVTKIEGVSFNWIENNQPSMGVIAQEIEKVLPELIKGDSTKTVNYNGLIGLLIESIKQQQTQIISLQTNIENLKKQINL